MKKIVESVVSILVTTMLAAACFWYRVMGYEPTKYQWHAGEEPQTLGSALFK